MASKRRNKGKERAKKAQARKAQAQQRHQDKILRRRREGYKQVQPGLWMRPCTPAEIEARRARGVPIAVVQ